MSGGSEGADRPLLRLLTLRLLIRGWFHDKKKKKFKFNNIKAAEEQEAHRSEHRG